MSGYSRKDLLFILLIIITFSMVGYARSLMNVEVYVDNNFIELKTNKNTVADLLKSIDIKLDKDDIVRPTPDTKLKDGMFIRVYRIEESEIKERKNIPYPTYHEYSSNLSLNKTIVKQQGKQGVKEITTQRISVDGVKIKDYVIDERIVSKPISRIVLKGTKRSSQPPPPLDGKMKVKKVLTMVATAYSDSVISCGKWAGSLTAIGLKPRYGVIAVDPKVIPLRTKLYVEGYGYGIAGDVGGAIKGNRIDLCFNTHQEAVNYGRKTVKVYILE